MPSYEVEHSTPLTDQQQDALAEAITKIHCETFNALSIFVNIRFTDIAIQSVYIAGKRKRTNRILANIRYGPARKRADYDLLCTRIQAAWDDVLNVHAGALDASQDTPRDLRAVFVLGSIVGGMEAGFLLPEPGADGRWIKDNMPAFEKKAKDGDADFETMLKEVQRRKMV